jgi:hypothetical protein
MLISAAVAASSAASDPTARPILATAYKVGVHCFKTGFHDYDKRRFRHAPEVPPRRPASVGCVSGWHAAR